MTFEDISAGWSRLWLPRERLPLSDWAEKHFYLSAEYSNRTGPVRLFGWQRQIFDAFTDESVRKITVMCGVQLVKTLLIQAALAYVIAETPGPVLLVQPKDSAAKKFSKKRLGPMLRDCPELRGRVKGGRRDANNTIEYKAFPGGDVTLVGAISPDNLARESIKFLFLDEVDKYPPSAGDEGDPIDLAIERTATFGSRAKVILTCSPTLAGRSRIGKSFDESDHRKPYVPCPHCGYPQVLAFSQVRQEAGGVYYRCVECRERWTDVQRWSACEQAEWRAQAQFNGHAGFWISHLYSPWKRLDEIFAKFQSVKDDPPRLQTFINTTLAELWEDRGEAPDHEKLMARREPVYRLGQVPLGVLFLTCGVDVQKTWLEGYVYGWGRGKQRWIVDHWRIEHNPYDAAAWDELTTRLNSTYRHAGGAHLAILRMAVDTGYATQEVYRWAREQGAGRVLACDGRDGGAALLGLPTKIDVTVGGRKVKHGANLWPVNVSMAKSELYGLLGKERPADGEPYPAGWVHFPADLEEEVFKQLTAEQLVTKVVKGHRKTEWQKTRERNEALDCCVYARAAAAHVGVDRFSEHRWCDLEVAVGQVPQEPRPAPAIVSTPIPEPIRPVVQQAAVRRPQTNWLGDRGRNWFAR